MRVIVDADSFVKEAKEVVIKAAIKRRICAHFVANHPISLPKKHNHIFFYQVGAGSDVADDFIVEHACLGDLVLTRDIILASRVLKNGVWAMNDRGYLFTEDAIGAKLSERLVMLRAREAGLYVAPSESRYTKKDLEKFANQLYNTMNVAQKGLRYLAECAMLDTC